MGGDKQGLPFARFLPIIHLQSRKPDPGKAKSNELRFTPRKVNGARPAAISLLPFLAHFPTVKAARKAGDAQADVFC